MQIRSARPVSAPTTRDPARGRVSRTPSTHRPRADTSKARFSRLAARMLRVFEPFGCRCTRAALREGRGSLDQPGLAAFCRLVGRVWAPRLALMIGAFTANRRTPLSSVPAMLVAAAAPADDDPNERWSAAAQPSQSPTRLFRKRDVVDRYSPYQRWFTGRQWCAVKLYFGEGLTHEQVGRVMNIGRSAVSMLLRRARRTMDLIDRLIADQRRRFRDSEPPENS
jgi:hypothetical protein